MARPWPVIVQMLEARSARMERARANQPVRRIGGEEVAYTDDLAELGMGRG